MTSQHAGIDRGTRPPGISLRWQFTLSYAGFLVIVGVVLLSVGLLVLRFVPEGALYTNDGEVLPNRKDLTAVFVEYSAYALGGLAVVGLVGGWLLSGVMLRRLDRLNDAVARMRGGDLTHRVALPGRSDEISRLADTFDDMLVRVQALADQQRRFAANASHELRTPHATIRTMLEVARADPNRDIEKLLDRVSQMNERSIALTEALLRLARFDGKPIDGVEVALDEAVATAVTKLSDLADHHRVLITTDCEPSSILGEQALLVQLVVNLLHNAIVHNIHNGRAHVFLRQEPARSVLLKITNSGTVLTPATMDRMMEPFARTTGRIRPSTSVHGGLGLGLSVAQSIAEAHTCRLEFTPNAQGGLTALVRFPAPYAANGPIS